MRLTAAVHAGRAPHDGEARAQRLARDALHPLRRPRLSALDQVHASMQSSRHPNRSSATQTREGRRTRDAPRKLQMKADQQAYKAPEAAT